MGDMLCSVPVFRSLRRALPDSHVALCGLPWAQSFVERYSHYIDEFIEFPGYPGLPERSCDPHTLVSFLQAMQQREFDLAIQLQGSGSYVNSLIALLAAKRSTGFYRVGEYCEKEENYLAYPEEGHEIERLLALCDFLGASRQGAHLEFPLTEQDTREFTQLHDRYGWNEQKVVCIHAGARFASRRWLPERFAAVADQLAEQGYSILLTGTQTERPIAESVATHMRHSAHCLAGLTTLGAVAALVHSARLVLTNDTGMSHIATAMRTPSVVLTMGSDPARWAPLDNHRHRVLAVPIACRPCDFETCPIGFPCAASLETADVLVACLQQLERYAHTASTDSDSTEPNRQLTNTTAPHPDSVITPA